jgi:preprotein translocase subunit SecG
VPTASHPFAAVAQPSALPTIGLPVAAPHAAATLSPEQRADLANYAMGGPKTPLAIHAPWLTHLFAGLFIFSAVLLVLLLAVQTTKQESLGGMGGREAFRPRLGLEGQLARATQAVAMFFVLTATLVSISGI